ncbi:S53 family peptidase [Oryzomonas japonica]|uniref:S53 family peptidase n=1 Tax=Oryzomonas japonica TaxID=2603858 RepID=UPI001FE48114|nr:S53 family peptidase [Oryzomonas japonica]
MRMRMVGLLCGLAGVLAAIPGWAQGIPNGMVVWPDSSVERDQDVGHRSHTNHLLLMYPLSGGISPAGMSPAAIRTAYNLPSYTLGQTQGAQTIVIVDAYDYPTAVADFNAFSASYGLPQETGSGNVLQVVYANGTKPAYNSGWSQEAALDIQWAHAMAPTAKIVLVEAASNSNSNLLAAVDVAGTISGVQEVSMSWGSGEFSSETAYDSHFTAPGVVYFAASGDSGGKVIWPSASAKVVSAGGTTLNMSSTGVFLGETAWSGSGGGTSKFVPRPTYQDAVQGIVGSKRGTPDVSFDANPNTGVSVYWQGGWYVFGGTSVASPSLAGIFNLAASTNGFAISSTSELTTVYANMNTSSANPGASNDFRDIISGSAGKNRCKTGYDLVTGIGSIWGLYGK